MRCIARDHACNAVDWCDRDGKSTAKKVHQAFATDLQVNVTHDDFDDFKSIPLRIISSVRHGYPE
jgi:hypothetical protein